LTKNSFRRTKQDPLQAIRDLPNDVEEALTFRNGFALPLESYPPEVWKRFMFDQETVAKKMGATPNIVQESARRRFSIS